MDRRGRLATAAGPGIGAMSSIRQSTSRAASTSQTGCLNALFRDQRLQRRFCVGKLLGGCMKPGGDDHAALE